VSVAERLTWAARAKGKRGADKRLGQKAERSGGGRNYQGSATGGAKSCRIARRSLIEGEAQPGKSWRQGLRLDSLALRRVDRVAPD
jgi:hypothetical protein